MTEGRHSGVVLLVGRDLKAQGRVEAACRGVGLEMEVTSVAGLERRLDREIPTLLVVDLDQGGDDAIRVVGEALSEGHLRAEGVVAYFSHVDVEVGERAARAGVKALPRGRFWRELPDLLTAATQV